MMKTGKRNSGFTIAELMMVIAILATLIALGVFSYKGWQDKYALEVKIKGLQSDILNTRVRTMERRRAHFVSLAARQYAVYEDTNTAPDGNGTLEPASDTQITLKDLGQDPHLKPTFVLSWSLDPDIKFTKRGFVDSTDLDPLDNDSRAICIFSDSNPEYDCIKISATRINLGRIIDQGGTCTDANCQAR